MKHQQNPNYFESQKWQGTVSGEAPSIILEKWLPCEVYSAPNKKVRIDEIGLLTETPKYLQITDSVRKTLAETGITLRGLNPIDKYEGPWVQLGKWWETGA